MEMQNASLDASFWNCAFKVHLVGYIFDLFQVYCCAAVESEILAGDPRRPELVFPQAALFVALKEKIHRAEPGSPIGLFGYGERYAIALAQEKNWALLINDGRAYEFASQLGVKCLSVPELAALLCASGRITPDAALTCFKLLRSTTNPRLIERGIRIVEQLKRKEGDK